MGGDRDGNRRERRSSRDRDVSWSEIDKRRNKSHHVGGDAPPGGGGRPQSNVTALGRYKADLNALFQRGEAGQTVKNVARNAGVRMVGGQPERQQDLRAILEAVGPAAITAAVDAFRTQHGELPEDPETLSQVLLHTDLDVQLEALTRLEHFLTGHVLPRKAVLLQRVKEIELRADTEELRAAAERVRDLLHG